jgi:diguanylate cyclase (GGDEF)-like protein
MVVVVQEEKLSAVLTEFAHTMATDFPIQAILDHLVKRIVEVLPVTAAGVTLISDGNPPHYIAASDESAMRFEMLQTEVGEGPCLTAYKSGVAVAVADLSQEDRFPRFRAAAAEAGLVAVFAFPLRHSEGRLGALDLYRSTPVSLDEEDMAAAQTLADVAAAYLVNAQSREDARKTSDSFQHSASHDPLTGLPNRALLLQRIQHAAQRGRRSRTHAAVLFVDVDRFKRVNDTYGHQVGDELLVAIGQRLSALVRPGDTLARFSGDEFVFLCEDMENAADGEVLAARIDAAFGEPFVLSGLDLALTASVGLAFAGAGEEVSTLLVANADIAMYQAKRRGGARHQVIDLREASETVSRNSLESGLRAAFADHDLSVAYQPIVHVADGVIGGVEALLRWENSKRGTVGALAMVEAAEESGLIGRIGEWVLEQACRDHELWAAAYPDLPLDLAVNVSARQLSSAFVATVSNVLSRTGTDPGALILEVTENILINDSDVTIATLTALKKLGVRLALDDFGTGFSSLSYLRRLPIDIVKIDQAFIADVRPPFNATITAAVTNLAHVLGLAVTAEGVETGDQRDAVQAIGCEFAQGYFYARPMPSSEIMAYLDALALANSKPDPLSRTG